MADLANEVLGLPVAVTELVNPPGVVAFVREHLSWPKPYRLASPQCAGFSLVVTRTMADGQHARHQHASQNHSRQLDILLSQAAGRIS